MKKITLLLATILLSCTLLCQTLTYSASKFKFYPSVKDSFPQEMELRMSVVLSADSIMSIYNLDSGTVLKIKATNFLGNGVTKDGKLLTNDFLGRNMDYPYEELNLILFYRKNDLSLDSILISDNISIIIIMIEFKLEEL